MPDRGQLMRLLKVRKRDILMARQRLAAAIAAHRRVGALIERVAALDRAGVGATFGHMLVLALHARDREALATAQLEHAARQGFADILQQRAALALLETRAKHVEAQLAAALRRGSTGPDELVPGLAHSLLLPVRDERPGGRGEQ